MANNVGNRLRCAAPLPIPGTFIRAADKPWPLIDAQLMSIARPTRPIALLLAFLLIAALVACGCACAADDAGLDWDSFERLPVFERGRMMPLDTYARAVVESICGRTHPTLGPYSEQSARLSAASAELFPDGKPRKFRPAELLFSWLVEPDRWQDVPFLIAKHKQLREEILKLPLRDAAGRRLCYISPREYLSADGLHRRIEELELRQQQQSREFRPVGVDLKVLELREAYYRFVLLTFDPNKAGYPSRRFRSQLERTVEAWRLLSAESGALAPGGEQYSASQLVRQAGRAIMKLRSSVDQDGPAERNGYDLARLDATAAELRRSAEKLCQYFPPGGNRLVDYLATRLVQQAYELHLALYEDGITLRLVPALNPGALEADRTEDEDHQPWLSFQALLTGSDALMADYPQAELAELRGAFAELKGAYLDRRAKDRTERFNQAMKRFVAAVRSFGEAVSPLREKLPIHRRDQSVLDRTAYPPPGATALEIAYNRLDPFFWSWVLALGALLSVTASLAVMRRAAFWLGVALLAVAQLASLAGFGYRFAITGLVPLTGMFESVVFMALCVGVLGLWFALLPLLRDGWQMAWRLTALPVGWEARSLDERHLQWCPKSCWTAFNCVLLLPRVWLTYVSFIWLARTSADSQRGYFDVFPPLDWAASLGTLVAGWLVWLVGLCVLGLALYYIPRAVPAALLCVVTVPRTLALRGLAEPLGQVYQRKHFALVAAAVSFLTALIGYYAPATVMPREITTAQAVLRDNFWLFVHVFTITASYGAGALAWGLSNIALGYYLFGRYQLKHITSPPRSGQADSPARASSEAKQRSDAATVEPPQICATLAQYAYASMKVAVLLLAAGIILGALWADKAWGRFWGWDAKEVWSLITLLAYLAILHARYIGWCGNFGLAVTAVLGFTSIIMAWYGVNHVLGSGLHSYGEGAGGQWEVTIAVAANWVFVGLAALRYITQMAPQPSQ